MIDECAIIGLRVDHEDPVPLVLGVTANKAENDDEPHNTISVPYRW